MYKAILIFCLINFSYAILQSHHYLKCTRCKYYKKNHKCNKFIKIDNEFKRLVTNPKYVIEDGFYANIVEVRENENLCGINATEFKPIF